MKKIVFFDIDGTLLDYNNKLPDSTKAAIQELKKNGTFVAIATGRAPFMFESIRKELDIDSYVCCNGQFVAFENEVVYKNSLKRNDMEKLYIRSQEKNHPLVFLDEYSMKSNVANHPFIAESLHSLGFPHPKVEKDFYTDKDVLQTLLFCEEDEEQVYVMEFPQFRFIRWHKYSVDILPAKGSKAEGIELMIKRLGFQLQDVYAFGDGRNDIEMITEVGTGIAMGNAVAEVKKHAQFITKSVDEDGIWYGLKELNLI